MDSLEKKFPEQEDPYCPYEFNETDVRQSFSDTIEVIYNQYD